VENVTHTLIGVALGEGICRMRGLSGRERAGVLWATALGANLPDFDFLMRPFVGGGNLGYLLHHRGYTHTMVLALPLAGVGAAFGRWVARRGRGSGDTAGAGSASAGTSGAASDGLPSWRLLLAATFIGILSHLGADSWNDYGVHPFWPATSRWFYGDFIFILEPLIWGVLLPWAFALTRSRFLKGVNLALLAFIVVLAWYSSLAPRGVAIGISCWCVAWLMAQWRRPSLKAAVAGLLAVLVTFAVDSRAAKHVLLEATPPGEEVLQAVTSPAPANPLCWRVILSSRQGDTYRARLGVLGLEPASPEACFGSAWLSERTAPLRAVEAPSLQALESGGRVKWLGEFSGSLAELEGYRARFCRVRGILRFARTPFWLAQGPGRVIVGDLRFDREKGLGFAEVEAGEGDECLRFEPPWSAF
jgi:inner membrane protein